MVGVALVTKLHHTPVGDRYRHYNKVPQKAKIIHTQKLLYKSMVFRRMHLGYRQLLAHARVSATTTRRASLRSRRASWMMRVVKAQAQTTATFYIEFVRVEAYSTGSSIAMSEIYIYINGVGDDVAATVLKMFTKRVKRRQEGHLATCAHFVPLTRSVGAVVTVCRFLIPQAVPHGPVAECPDSTSPTAAYLGPYNLPLSCVCAFFRGHFLVFRVANFESTLTAVADFGALELRNLLRSDADGGRGHGLHPLGDDFGFVVTSSRRPRSPAAKLLNGQMSNFESTLTAVADFGA